MTSFSGTVYPNGEFTIGYSARKLQREDVAVSRLEYSREEEWRSCALRVHGYDACMEVFGGEAPLGSSSVPISHTRKPKGLKGLTSNARRKIRNAAFILEENFGRRHCGFGTVTLPELSPSDYIEVHKHWGDIVRTFIQWAGRKLESRSVSPQIVHITEIQTKRHEQSGTAYLHLHFCYPCRPGSNYKWYLPADEVRLAWARAVSAFCSAEYDFNASSDTVVVKVPLGKYLSKYLSKGASCIEGALRDGLPMEALGHWWGWTRSLRVAVSERTIPAAGLVERIWRHLDKWVCSGWVSRVHFVYIPFKDSGDRCIGLVGNLSTYAMGVISSIYMT